MKVLRILILSFFVIPLIGSISTGISLKTRNNSPNLCTASTSTDDAGATPGDCWTHSGFNLPLSCTSLTTFQCMANTPLFYEYVVCKLDSGIELGASWEVNDITPIDIIETDSSGVKKIIHTFMLREKTSCINDDTTFCVVANSIHKMKINKMGSVAADTEVGINFRYAPSGIVDGITPTRHRITCSLSFQ